MKVNFLHHIPKGFLTSRVEDLHDLLCGPTLIHLEGERKDPIFISTLLHGNEHTGVMAIQEVLRQYQNQKLPRSLIIFIGNTLAAKTNCRVVAGQTDFNRIWEAGDTDEHLMATEVYAYAKNAKLFANVDIHNNTGKNPFYGCINTLASQNIELAKLFSPRIVFFTEPSSVQSMAFSEICPSVTLEAGKSGERISEVVIFLEKLLELDHFQENMDISGTDIYHTTGRMFIDPTTTIRINQHIQRENEIELIPNIDDLNFQCLKPETLLGHCIEEVLIKVINNSGVDVTREYLKLHNQKILTKKEFIPSMFTQDKEIIRQDCLGYVMERMKF